MNIRKKSLICALVLSLLSFSSSSHAEEAVAYTGGRGYEANRESMRLTPALALSAIALGSIIAFAFIKSDSTHSHND